MTAALERKRSHAEAADRHRSGSAVIGSTFAVKRARMTIEKMREAYAAQPFVPFVIHLADGREIPVRSPEFMLPAPSGRTIVVFQPDDRMNIIDLLLVTDLEFKNGSRKRRSA